MIERSKPESVLAEREMLVSWLDYHRATLEWKCEGLTAEQLCDLSVPPSPLSLIGLVRHMTDVERAWLRRRFEGEEVDPLYPRSPDGGDTAFDAVTPAMVEPSLVAYRAECERSREVLDRHSLDEISTTKFGDRSLGMRWVVTHLIEEYARHNGHADLLRERIDGATGA